MKKLISAAPILLVLLAGYLLLWPVPIDPVPWRAPEPPAMAGPYAPNDALRTAKRIDLAFGRGPEDIAVDRFGIVYGGLDDGVIARYDPHTSTWDRFADTGGRPLGLHFDANDNLIVADAERGLLSVDVNGTVTVLVDEADDVPFGFTDDVDIAPDGKIYFSDASHKLGWEDWKLDALEHRPLGRLLVYDPTTRETRVLMPALCFANGVAVEPGGRFVLVNETWNYRVWRYWLEGEKAGTEEILIDNLPGFPDGISAGTKVFWVALASTRNARLDGMAEKPYMRKLVARLPAFMQPEEAEVAFVLGIDDSGAVVHNLQDMKGTRFSMVTSVQEHEGTLYLGSLKQPAFATFPVPR